MPEERVELSWGCPRRILSPLRLPFRHSGEGRKYSHAHSLRGDARTAREVTQQDVTWGDLTFCDCETLTGNRTGCRRHATFCASSRPRGCTGFPGTCLAERSAGRTTEGATGSSRSSGNHLRAKKGEANHASANLPGPRARAARGGPRGRIHSDRRLSRHFAPAARSLVCLEIGRA